MRSAIKLITAMTRVERMALGVLTLVLVLSLGMLLRMFYVENTTNVAQQGGAYIEGSVGEVLPLNPWFVTGNDVNRDILALVFAGLMKYDPATGKMTDDLAKVTVSGDNRVYTAVLKPNLFWHDTTAKSQHPVTADDVLFTFQTIQKPGFGNPILQQNFRGVEVEKIDAQTVRFKLAKPYSFFTSNLALALLPKNAFDGVPVDKLHEALDFGFHPIGAGPYSFVSLLQTDVSTEVTLKRFPRPGMPEYNIDRVVFRVFSDYSALLTDIMNMNGVRGVPRNEKGQPILPKRFRPIPYTLPQYVSLFFNLDRPIPADRNVRLGLQLGTNKQEVVDAIHEIQVVDTPLLEIDLSDWRYKFDAAAAQGAFFESNWNMPEKIRLQRLLEQRNTNAVGPLKGAQRIVYLGTGAVLTLTGSIGKLTFPSYVNGVAVQTGSSVPGTHTGSWVVKLKAGTGTGGSLKLGVNILKMTDDKGDIVDSAYMERFTDVAIFNRAVEEQRLVDRFIASKQLKTSDPAFVGISTLYLDRGFLRLKTPADLPHTRINDQGKELTLKLLTSNRPETYAVVANVIKKQWEALGAKVVLDIPANKKEFEDKLLKRDYDVVLFGQSLFDNLDSYPYWHSSQIQERDNPKDLKLDAFNLSQYASFEADTLLARIRETSDAKSRANALRDLNELWKRDLPALVLYSPLNVYAYDESVYGVNLGKLSLHADRFAHFNDWYVTTRRRFLDGRGWLNFPSWLVGLLARG